MAKGLYYGVSNLAKRVRKLYVGVANLARKVIKGYVGDANGLARMFYSADEEITFTASTNPDWTVPDGATTIDVFAVGGGGGAGGCYSQTTGTWDANQNYNELLRYGASGGGGYTVTAYGIPVTGGEKLKVYIGAGGTGGDSFYNVNGSNSGDVTSRDLVTHGGDGGDTMLVRGTTSLVTAAGGKGGYHQNFSQSGMSIDGANGGNASGAAGGSLEQIHVKPNGHQFDYDTIHFVGDANAPSGAAARAQQWGNDGTEGSNGGAVSYWDYDRLENVFTPGQENVASGGTGQGRNTRRFGEAGGTVYSTVAGPRTANTGNSGSLGTGLASTKNGMSGIMIIKIHY